jgi:hypothetical protein
MAVDSAGVQGVAGQTAIGEIVAGPHVIEILLAAVGIAMNPPAVIAAILLVTASRRKAIAFACGWVVGLLIVGCVVMIVGDVVDQPFGASVPIFVAKAVVGISLLGMAASKWLSHRRSSGDKELPRWMSWLYDLSAPSAFLAAAAFAALNPKTIAFNAAGVFAILAASFRTETEWTALVVFVVLSSLSVTAPVIIAVLFPRRSSGVLALAESWLGDNSSVVAATVLLVLGLMVLYSGAEGLVQFYRSA